MLRQVARRSVSRPRREAWHGLQEFTQSESAQTAFRNTRASDTAVTLKIKSAEEASKKPIDWAHWESTISHSDLVSSLREFHDSQISLLDAALKEDHRAKVTGQTQGWDLFENAVKSCEKSVENSEEIVKNGARALWMSYNNPPISQVSTSEWLDVDQYWQAFVEKHHYYHDHLASLVEDPESKEYDQKQESDLIKKWNVFDGKQDPRFNNKMLYQRPSYEYYELYRGPLVEHMIFYLTKTGGDSRLFPELMPHKWFCEIYDIRFNLYDALQKRRRTEQFAQLARDLPHDYHPQSLDQGDTYYAKLIQRENEVVQASVARLMGNFIFLSEHVPIQTSSALYRVLDEPGTYYTLGDDVNALFFKPQAGIKTANPTDAYQTWMDHLFMTGRRLPVAYQTTFQSFCEVLETRKEGLNGAWFNVEGESLREAFFRRLKKDDPAYDIFQEYNTEFVTRWESAKEITKEEALELIVDVERRYELETVEFDNLYLRKDIDTVLNLATVDSLDSALTGGEIATDKETLALTSSEIVDKINASKID